MAQQVATTENVHQEVTSTGIDHRKMLVWLFLASDCMFFGTLIVTYLIYYGQSVVGPTPTDVFSIPVTSVSTFVLLISSFMMVLAYNAISHGRVKAFRVWLLGTAILGATFLGFQVFEFFEFSHGEHHLTPRTNLFGTTFFTLTGFHGAHVTIGVIWLLSLIGFSFKRDLTKDHALNVDMAALYWHFVDIVWIVIFTLIYLLGVS